MWIRNVFRRIIEGLLLSRGKGSCFLEVFVLKSSFVNVGTVVYVEVGEWICVFKGICRVGF